MQHGPNLSVASHIVCCVSFLFSFRLKPGELTLVCLSAASDVHGDTGDLGLVASESPVTSGHKSDQEIALTLKEDHEVAAGVLKASVDFPEEKHPVSDGPPDTQEIHVKTLIFYLLVVV